MPDLKAMRGRPIAAAPRIPSSRLLDLAIRLLPLPALGLVIASASGEPCCSAVLNAMMMRHWQDYAYVVVDVGEVLPDPCGWRLLCPMPGDADRAPTISNLLVFDDGKPLGPAHSVLQKIIERPALGRLVRICLVICGVLVAIRQRRGVESGAC